MLSIHYGDFDGYVPDPDMFFNNTYEEDWLNDPFVIQMISDVDKSTVLSSGVIDSKVLGLILPERLSGGVKTLIFVLKRPDMIFNGSACGENCAEWLLKIGEKQDVTIRLGYLMPFNEPFKIHVINNNTIYTKWRDIVMNCYMYL